MKPVKIGLLPLYIKLYDDYSAERRPAIEAYQHAVEDALEGRGLEVVRVPVCRLASEFREAMANFEAQDVDAVVTLHLAYSPSLESSEVLKNTAKPLLVLDTTRDATFDPDTDPDLLMYNHGIHGVQDMCNLLQRNHKPFSICAGPWERSDVLDRIAEQAKAAAAARAFRAQRVGRVGEPFAGMGDFAIEPQEFAQLGIEVVPMDLRSFPQRMAAVSDAAVAAESARDAERFVVKADRAAVDAVNRVSLALRGWLTDQKLTAFSVSFLATSAELLPYMPFIEASKAMERGIGYAGEGDLLTAALVGALLSEFPDTSFMEMFCPDWTHDAIYISHMGEFNLRVGKGGGRLQVDRFQYTSAGDPTVVFDTFRPGPAVVVNLAPQGNGRFRLVLAPVEMLDVRPDNAHADTVNGWFRPALPIAPFLEAYSRAGGTHHSALVYGVRVESMRLFGELLGFETVVIA